MKVVKLLPSLASLAVLLASVPTFAATYYNSDAED